MPSDLERLWEDAPLPDEERIEKIANDIAETAEKLAQVLGGKKEGN